MLSSDHTVPHRRNPFQAALALPASIPVRLRRHMSGGVYRPEIDGLRFFAIAIVVVGHFAERAARFFPQTDAHGESLIGSLLQRPGIGVFLFFAVSGFIIASQARKAKESTLSGTFLGRYFGRRLLRIEPPYMILLVASLLFIGLTGYSPDGAQQFWKQPDSLSVSFIGSVFYVHKLVWGTFPRLFPPGWSLEAEVQFYILAPLLFWVWFKLKNNAVRIAFGAAVLMAGCLMSLSTATKAGPLFIDASIVRYFHYFWLGILLSDMQGWMAEKTFALPSWAGSLVGWSGLLLYLIVPNAPDDLASGVATRFAIYVAVIAMFASAMAAQSGFRAFCARPWISLIGGACYSIYLTHLQLIQVMTGIAAKAGMPGNLAALIALAVIEIVIVVFAGLVFYALIERTFMFSDWHTRLWGRLKMLRGKNASRSALADSQAAE